MFDKDLSGTIDIFEFQQLYTYINQWLSAFKGYDRDGSGFIDEGELTQGIIYIFNLPLKKVADVYLILAFQQMGYRFTPAFVKFLVSKSDPVTKNKISVDQFILICVQVQRFTGTL